MARRTISGATGYDGNVRIVIRVVNALIGNYAVTLGASSLFAVLLVLGGCARSEAAALASMIGFLLYLVILIYAFHTPHILRLGIAMTIGAAASYGLAQWLARALG